MFRVDDGKFVRHIATGLSNPVDVEEVEGGWLVACRVDPEYGVRHFAGSCRAGGVSTGDGLPCLGSLGAPDEWYTVPVGLAVVPGLGLAVRERGTGSGMRGCVRVFARPQDIAMAPMSTLRVAWMVAVWRAVATHRRAA
jgi:hypothetical protein